MNQLPAFPPAIQAPPTHTPDPIALQSPRALDALVAVLGDPLLVHEVASGPFGTWDELARSSPASRATHIAPWAARLYLPLECPPLAFPGLDIDVVTRYEDAYPTSLLEAPAPPPVLRVRGIVDHARPLVAIAGPRWPSPFAVRWAREATRVAAARGWGIVALIDGGCGSVALSEATRIGAVAVAVAGADPAVLLEGELLAGQLVDGGGGVLSEWQHGERPSELRLYCSARLVPALSMAIVVCEAGIHAAGGADLIRAAIDLDRPIVVPAPAGPLQATELERAGGALLTDPAAAGLWITGAGRRSPLAAAVADGPGLADWLTARHQAPSAG